MSPTTSSRAPSFGPTIGTHHHGERFAEPQAGGALRIGVLDAAPRTNQCVRRAILRLGYEPVLFASMAELRAHGSRPGSLASLLITCPDDADGGQRLIAEVRAIWGYSLPLILSTDKSLLLEISILEAGVDDAVEVTPSSLKDAYCMLESFLKWRNLPVAQEPRSLFISNNPHEAHT
jgi:hypothetical protein